MKNDYARLGKISNAAVLTGRGTRIRDIYCKDGLITRVTRPSTGRRIGRDRTIDARGKVVIPGLIDCHIHLFGVALNDVTIDLKGAGSVREMQERVAEWQRGKGKRNRDWLVGRGWDQDLFEEKRLPKKTDIDSVCKNVPAIMVRICGHIAVLNSKAISKITQLEHFSSQLVPRSDDGQIEGIVKEEALDAVRRVIPSPPRKLLTQLVQQAQQKALGLGLVGVHSILSDDWENELNVIRSLDRKEKLVLKTSLFLPLSALSTIETMTLLQRRRKLNGVNFATLGFKLFADGSLGARTAALLTPYSDDRGNSGILYYDSQYIEDVARRVKKLGMVLACHAIGDRAVKQVAKAYKTAGILPSDRFRIEHASVLNNAIVAELKNTVVSVQPSFIGSDYWMTDRLGTREDRFAYPLKTLLRLKGEDLIAGSDSPVESMNPFEGVSAAMKNPNKAESLSLWEALMLYSGNAEDKSPLTHGFGRLRDGDGCTLVMVDCKKLRDIPSSKVSAVAINGKIVFEK